MLTKFCVQTLLCARRAVAAQGVLRHVQPYATGTESSRVVEIEDDQAFQQRLKKLDEQGRAAVVDFTAKWCGPCRQIAPVYEQLSKSHPETDFLKVDIDNARLAGTVGREMITAVPTFVFYKGTKRLGEITGARLDALKDMLQRLRTESSQQKPAASAS